MTKAFSDLFILSFAAWFSLGLMYYAIKVAATHIQEQGFGRELVAFAGIFGVGAICFYQFFLGSENLFTGLEIVDQ